MSRPNERAEILTQGVQGQPGGAIRRKPGRREDVSSSVVVVVRAVLEEAHVDRPGCAQSSEIKRGLRPLTESKQAIYRLGCRAGAS